jgi:N-carbamoyl-L-amino-acid hydrolase
MTSSEIGDNLTGAVDGDRLWQTIEAFARIGALPGGGCSRPAFSDEDRTARQLFAQSAGEAGCDVRIDAFGNMFAWRPGATPHAPAVLVGSHLDTQPHGGRFDGVFGVLAGLEVVRALNDACIKTEAPVVVVNWTNEEGVRYAPGLTGSGAFSGLLDRQNVLDIKGVDGSRFGDEVAKSGFAGEFAPEARDFKVYVEPHIEQGPYLESAGLPVGVVPAVQGVHWITIELTGADRHAGTTAMNARRDTFMASARMAVEMREAALRASSEIRFTVGRIKLEPGSANTVPGRATFEIDLRHAEKSVLEDVEAEFRRIADRIAAEENVGHSFKRVMDVPPIVFDEEVVAAVERAVVHSGYPVHRIVSGAMHDASNLAHIIPTAMIFVPSHDGISHAEDEWTEPEHITAGCRVLFNTVLELAGVRSTT